MTEEDYRREEFPPLTGWELPLDELTTMLKQGEVILAGETKGIKVDLDNPNLRIPTYIPWSLRNKR